MIKEKLEKIKESALEELQNKKNNLSVEDIRVKYLGKKGELTKILRGMKSLSPEERPVVGKLANEIRTLLENSIEETSKKMKALKTEEKLRSETIDITMPGVKQNIGRSHERDIYFHGIYYRRGT